MKKTDYEKDLPNLIHKHYCWSDVLRELGLSNRGGNIKTATKWAEKLNLDTSHFDPDKGILQGQLREGSTEFNISELFRVNSTSGNGTIKNRVLRDNLIEYKCDECGLGNNWNGKSLTLQLDHINGIYNDHRLENLRFLCPNCHTQTDNWGNRTGSRVNLDKPIKVSRDELNVKWFKEYIIKNQGKISTIESSDIDFGKWGWSKQVSELIDIRPQKVAEWMRRYLPGIYDTAFKIGEGKKHLNIDEYRYKQDQERQRKIDIVLSMNLDFSKRGWVTQISNETGMDVSKVSKWMKKNMPM